MRKKSLFAATLALTALGVSGAQAQDASAVAAPAVTVRAAPHPDFDRVVFDWPRTVTFQLHHDGAQASVHFDAAGEVKLSPDMLAHLTRAHGFSVRQEAGDQVTVSFAVDPQAVVKSFTSNTSVVLDISGKDAPVAPPAPSPVVPQTPPAADKPSDAPTPLLPVASALTPPPALSKPAAATPPVKQEVAAPPAPAADVPPPSTAAPVPLSLKTAPSLAMASTTRVKRADEPQIDLGNEATVVAALDAHIPTRVAIYQRAGVGYIIFERKLSLTPAALENGKPALINLQPLDMPKNSGYSFALPSNVALHATLDGTVWKILLSKKQTDLPVTTALIAQPDFALGARFLLPLPDAPEPIKFTDPLIGDDLILVPLQQSEAFSVGRRMSDFTIIPAAQGLVIKPLNEKLIVRTVSDGVEITAESGLQLSHAADTGASQQSAIKARDAAAGKSIFDFATWKGKPRETYSATRQRLQQIIVDVPETERNRARLELARFYFANGNGEEAVALLQLLLEQVPDLRLHDDYVSLLGAAQILSYHAEDGLWALGKPSIANQPEIELWRAVGLAQQRNWKDAEEKFSVRESLLTGYPDPFFSRFFVLAIESALAVGKEQEAADWLDFVSNAPHLASIDPALTYLRGALRAKAGMAQDAKQAWEDVAASNDRLYKVRAELALIDLAVSTESLTPAQAADRLEALRFAWRGDDLEVDILHRLGQFYISAKNVKAGLATLSQAVTLYPDSPLTPQIHTEMAQIFHDVFLTDLGKKLTPLDFLTLYQQYRDLMPAGKDGDGVIRNLAERLISIDLLDQAEGLLEDLAKNRLQGAEKDHTLLRLAGIRLLDHKPTESLAAIDLIGSDALSTDMQNERLLLRVRALSELHRDADAAALLKDNNSQGAKMLRADTAMHAQNWAEAAKYLMELVGAPPAKNGALSADQAGWLLSAAIAYALSDDQTGLDKLAIDYGSFMAATAQKDTFRMLTEPDKTGQMKDLAAAQAQISQLDMFQGFLNSYRTSAVPVAEPPKKP